MGDMWLGLTWMNRLGPWKMTQWSSNSVVAVFCGGCAPPLAYPTCIRSAQVNAVQAVRHPLEMGSFFEDSQSSRLKGLTFTHFHIQYPPKWQDIVFSHPNKRKPLTVALQAGAGGSRANGDPRPGRGSWGAGKSYWPMVVDDGNSDEWDEWI